MRLLMTTDTVVTEQWQHTLDLITALQTYDIEVALATMGAPLTADQRREARRIPGLSLYESTYKLEWMPDGWRDISKAGEWLRDLEAVVKADVIHLHQYAYGALAWRAPVIISGHACALSWWWAVNGEDAPAVWDSYRDRAARGLRCASIVVAPTYAMLNELEQYYGSLPLSYVIPTGRSRDLLAAQEKDPIILGVGATGDRAKNLTALDRVAPLLSWRVCIAGENSRAGLHQTLHNVDLLGTLARGDLDRWYERAAIFALPARYEPFGVSILDAALSGCALVLTSIPALREVWDGAAMFVPQDNDDALRRALDALIDDAPLRQALALRAQKRARTLSADHMAAGYAQLYTRLRGVRRHARSA